MWKVLKPALLVGAAQIAIVFILFCFAYTIAHASTIFLYCGEFDNGLGSPYCSFYDYNHPLVATDAYYFQGIYPDDSVPDGVGHGSPSLLFWAEYIPSYDRWVRYVNGSDDWILQITPSAPSNNSSAFVVLSPNTNTDTRISTTTSSTSVDFKAKYYVNDSDPALQWKTASTTQYVLNLTRHDVASTSQYAFSAGANTNQWYSPEITMTLPSGSVWTYNWSLYAPSDTIFPYSLQSGIYAFAVIGNPLLIQFGVPSLGNVSGLSVGTTTAPAPCGITDLQGCVQNALVYLFYPSTASLDQFGSLWTLIEYKPPFGYVVATIGAIKNFTASTTPAFALGTIPFVESIFSPFRLGIAALLWLVFIVAFYHRLTLLDI